MLLIRLTITVCSESNYYGIQGSPNDWFKSYLTNRKQFVSTNGHDSHEVDMLVGAPHGSMQSLCNI